MPRVFSDLRTVEYGASGCPEAPFRVRDSHALGKALARTGLPRLIEAFLEGFFE